ncbi:MAG: metal ABC transporter permease [Candidatus Hadarchaeia archaeon]
MDFLMIMIMGLSIGAAAGYIGSLMVTKRMALTGGALGHLTLPGMALALLYGFDVSFGAFVFLVIGITLIWIFKSSSELSMEAVTAVVFASSVSIAFLFLPEEHAFPALIGDVSQVSLLHMVLTVAISLLIFAITKLIYPKMILSSLSEDVAISEGLNVRKYNLVYLFGIALAVALGVRVVGSLLTAALVAIPASASKNLSRNHFQYSYGALLIGAVSACFGILAYEFIGTPFGIIELDSPGPYIIISSSAIFVISLFFRRK